MNEAEMEALKADVQKNVLQRIKRRKKDIEEDLAEYISQAIQTFTVDTGFVVNDISVHVNSSNIERRVVGREADTFSCVSVDLHTCL